MKKIYYSDKLPSLLTRARRTWDKVSKTSTTTKKDLRSRRGQLLLLPARGIQAPSSLWHASRHYLELARQCCCSCRAHRERERGFFILFLLNLPRPIYIYTHTHNPTKIHYCVRVYALFSFNALILYPCVRKRTRRPSTILNSPAILLYFSSGVPHRAHCVCSRTCCSLFQPFFFTFFFFLLSFFIYLRIRYYRLCITRLIVTISKTTVLCVCTYELTYLKSV